MRFEHVYEVDPALMTEHVRQQEIPAWDTHRIVASRWDHLAWMHEHWADTVVHGEELLAELEAEGSTLRRKSRDGMIDTQPPRRAKT